MRDRFSTEVQRVYTDTQRSTRYGQTYPVEKLFTVDGITVYRFRDNDRYVYFTNRTGDVQYSYQKRVGKATKNVKVQTMCNNNGQENKH
nr:MAG: protein of unknown function DUF4884 [Bacteriophage sp.]